MDAHYTSAALIAEITLLRQTNRELIDSLEGMLEGEECECELMSRIYQYLTRACSFCEASQVIAKAKELHS